MKIRGVFLLFSLVLAFSSCKKEDEKEEVKIDYRDRFNYFVSFNVENNTTAFMDINLITRDQKIHVISIAPQTTLSSNIHCNSIFELTHVDTKDVEFASGILEIELTLQKTLLKRDYVGEDKKYFNWYYVNDVLQQ